MDALILIAVALVGAGIVLSIVMDKPDPNLPVLAYTGCYLDDTLPSICIVHEGGTTLYENQYYVRGLDASQQIIEPEASWIYPGDFRLGTSVCTTDPRVSAIQLIVYDESGTTLHGTRYPLEACSGEVGTEPSEPSPLACLDPCPGDMYRDPITCACTCPDGQIFQDGSCVDPDPPSIGNVCADLDGRIEIAFGTIRGAEPADKLYFVGAGNVTLREDTYPFTTLHYVSEPVLFVTLVRDGEIIATAPVEQCPSSCYPGYTLGSYGICQPRELAFIACKVDADAVQITWDLGREPGIAYEIELVGTIQDGTQNQSQIYTRTYTTLPSVEEFFAHDPVMDIQEFIVRYNGRVVGQTSSILPCDSVKTPTLFACALDRGGRQVQVTAQHVNVREDSLWRVTTVDGTMDIPVTGSTPWEISIIDRITSIALVQFGEVVASANSTQPCDPTICDSVHGLWNEMTSTCIPCGPGNYPADGVCVPAPLADVTACWLNSARTQVTVAGGQSAAYQVSINNALSPETHLGSSTHTITEPITSVQLFLDGVETANVTPNSYCRGTCPPHKIWDGNACVCDEENGYLPSPETDRCTCAPGFRGNGDTCEFITFDFDVCWSFEDQTAVRLTVPASVYGVPYSATFNDIVNDYIGGRTAPLISSDRVFSLSLSLKNPKRLIGQQSAIHYCSLVTCTDPNKTWDPTTQTCICAPPLMDNGQGVCFDTGCQDRQIWDELLGCRCTGAHIIAGPHDSCICEPGYEMKNGSCVPKQLTFLQDLFFCWPRSNQKELCVSGGEIGAVYYVYKDDKAALLGTHVGGTRTCWTWSGSGTLVDFSMYLGNDRVGLITTDLYSAQHAYQCSNFCSLNNNWHLAPGSAHMNPGSPRVVCECDYGYEKRGNNCDLIQFTSLACFVLETNDRAVTLINIPPTVYGYPYKACSGTTCIDFIAGQSQPLQYATSVTSLVIRLNNQPDNPIVGHAAAYPCS